MAVRKASTSSIELPIQYREARFQPKTFDEDARTVELVWTTGAVVRRRSFFDGEFEEELVLDDGAVRMDRLDGGGANLLDSHSKMSLKDVLGVVEKAWFDGKGKSRVGKAVVRFSEREDVEPIFRDVQSGIIRNVSVGYAIHRVEKIERKNNIPLVRLVDWEPYELSMVTVPADAGAKVRSDEERVFRCVVHDVRSSEMSKKLSQEAVPGTAGTTEERVDEPVVEDDELVVEENDKQVSDEGGGAAAAARGKKDEGKVKKTSTSRSSTTTTQDQPRDPGISEEEVQRRVSVALDAEEDRQSRIRKACVALRIDKEVGERLIRARTPVDEAISALFEQAAKRDEARKVVGTTVSTRVEAGDQDEDETRALAIRSAILHRYDPKKFAIERGGEEYVGYSLLEIGRRCLEDAGVRTRGWSRSELAKRALMPGYGVRAGLHTTTDFANILADVANKTLRAAYDQAPRTYTSFCRRATAPDFKTVNRMQLGEAPVLVRKNEHGEFQRGTVSDAKESYALVTYGRIFGITREVVVNDDLQAFTRMPSLFGMAAAQKESDVVWAVILANAAMGDGTTLFNANHGNVGTGAIAVNTIGAGRAVMSKQTGLDGRTLLNVMARYIIVPPELETVTEQIVASVTPVTTLSEQVPPSVRSLIPISEPRLSVGVTLDNPDGGFTTLSGSNVVWYLAADPAQIDTIEYAYLEGEEGVSIDTRIGFDVDGVEVRARLDFAAKAIDWRGLYKSSGS